MFIFKYILKYLFELFILDELVKSQKSDGTVKSSRCKARKSEGMKRTYLYAAMTEDAAERRRWTFYEAVILGRQTHTTSNSTERR